MKIIRFIAVFAILIHAISACGQNSKIKKCKIEFYLLKKEIVSVDSVTGLRSAFNATLNDLQDTAFIKDSEILSFEIQRDTTDSRVIERHQFNVSKSVTDRIQGVYGDEIYKKGLDIPLCCGKQFALVVDGQIIYTGYFWNFLSSFGCDGVTAIAHNGQIDINRKLPDYGKEDGELDSRINSILFDCLKSTNRMKNDD